VVEDLDGRPLEHRCDAMSDLSEQHMLAMATSLVGMLTEPGQQLVGVDKLAASRRQARVTSS
jgi:hypothetical protein